MNDIGSVRILLVSDDTKFLQLLETEFPAVEGYVIEAMATGMLSIKNLAVQPDVMLVEYPPDEHDAVALNDNVLSAVISAELPIPVIMLLSHERNDNQLAIKSMLHKAVDYVVKDETAFMHLKNIITRLLKYRKLEKQLNWYMDRM